METILTNYAGPIRRETIAGRQFFVVPSTMIVPGVLNGSKGRLLYLPEDVSHNHDQWDGMPLTIGHPQDENGNYVKARTPQIANNYEIGRVYETKFDDHLVNESWFDVDLLTRSKHPDAPVILNKLRAGEPIELSTGLFTKNIPAAPGSSYFGQPYDFIATNFRPDHLAVLVRQKGACSLKDGCGIGVVNSTPADDLPGDNPVDDSDPVDDTDVYDEPVQNSERTLLQKFVDLFSTNASPNQPKSLNTGKYKKMGAGTGRGPCHEAAQAGAYGPKPCDCEDKSDCKCVKAPVEPTANSQQEQDVTKKDAITYLTANCSCWKGEDKTLETFTENKLKELVEADKVAKQNEIVANAVKDVIDLDDADETDLTANAMPEFIKKKMDAKKKKGSKEEDMMDGGEDDEEETPVKNMTANEWLATAPPEIQSAVRNSMRIEAREKDSVIAKLTANVTDPKSKARITTNLRGKSLDELADMLLLVPTANHQDDERPGNVGRLFGFLGAEGAPIVTNETPIDKKSGLKVPTINFRKLREQQNKARA